MADSVIGALRVLLGVDTAAFSEGLTKAEKSLANFSKQFGTIAAGAAAAVVAAGAALALGVEKSIAQADQLGKMAQKFGIPVEELSRLKFAAELSDVSLESLGKSLGKLSNSLTQAASKPTSDAANAFNALGIAVRNSDGSVKSSEQALLDIADRFSELKDGAGKTAVSIALFGKSGADLIPLLNQGKSGIKGLKDEAAALGLTVTSQTAKAAEEFNDNMKRLGAVLTGIFTQLAAGAAGPLADFTHSLVEISKSSNLVEEAGANIAIAFTKIVQIGLTVALTFNRIGVEWKALQEFLQTDIFSGKVAENFNKFIDAGKESVRQLELLKLSFQSTWDPIGTTGEALAGLGAKVGKAQKDFNFAAFGGKNAIDQYVDSVNKAIAAQQAEAQTVGMAAGAKEKLKTVLEGIQIAQNNNIPVTEALRARLQALGEQAATSAQQLAAANFIQDALPEWQKLQDKITEIQGLMDKFPDKANQLGAALLKSQLAVQEFILSTAATALGQFGQLFSAFGKQNKQMFEIAKAFNIAQAIMNTAAAVTKVWSQWAAWPPIAIALSAAAVAAGAAQIATITSQKFTGAAFGGSFKVPGGSMSVDTKLIPMMLAPGERVDVTPASRAGGGDSILVIPSIKPKDFFTGETVREMVFAIDQWMKDGGTGIRLST